MDLTEVVQLSLIAILIVVVGRQALAIRAVQRSWRDHLAVDHALDLAQTPMSHDEEPDWPSTDYLSVGKPIPTAVGARIQGRWALLILAKADCETCAAVLSGLDEVRPMVSGYDVQVLMLGGEGPAQTKDWIITSDPEAASLPIPSMFLVDPAGVVQGRGTLVSSHDLVVFASDGRHHGLGPALAPVAHD